MVIFIGLSFSVDEVSTTAIDRKAGLIDEGSVPITRAREVDEGVLEVPHAEWVRAGCLAMQDIYFRIPVKLRKLWGIGLAGPSGWIALDPDLDPISPLRLTPRMSFVDDFVRWLEANPKQRSHIFQVLSPKDYFRFRVSGGLATDVTDASLSGLLDLDRRYWDDERLEEREVLASWLPPAFDSGAATGRISQDGVNMTGVPGGIWFVAGAESSASREIAAHDPRRGGLYVLLDGDWCELRVSVPAGVSSERTPPGWRRLNSALTDWHVLSRPRRVRSDGGGPDREQVRAAIEDAARELATADIQVTRVVLDGAAALPEWAPGVTSLPVEAGRFAGKRDRGPALLAGLAKRVFRDADDLYRKLRDAPTDQNGDDQPDGLEAS